MCSHFKADTFVSDAKILDFQVFHASGHAEVKFVVALGDDFVMTIFMNHEDDASKEVYLKTSLQEKVMNITLFNMILLRPATATTRPIHFANNTQIKTCFYLQITMFRPNVDTQDWLYAVTFFEKPDVK